MSANGTKPTFTAASIRSTLDPIADGDRCPTGQSTLRMRSVCWRSIMKIRLAKHRSIASCHLIKG
jgi:hypothetical protein